MLDSQWPRVVPHSPGGEVPDAVVRLLSFSARLFGVQDDVVDALARIYPHTSRACATRSAFIHADSHIADIRLDDVIGPDLVGVSQISETLGTLEFLLDTLALRSFDNHLVLHSGAVAVGDMGFLIPAASGAGKSTLVAALAQSGFVVLSDEFAILDIGTLRLRPFPKALCLKTGGRLVVERAFGVSLDTVPVRRVNHQCVSFVSAQRMFPVERCATPGAIVILNRVSSGKSSITAISRAEALATLLQQSLNVPQHGVSGIDTLVGLVESTECLRLTYADARDAVGSIERFVSAI
ncbi:MAG TPA: hypothetical protein VFV93_10335 [Thermomicrobiales bacterium]|nr:hypothetical protein [Thermomicrobiales bacterium]